ncbi:GpE family phage tail protein, partial [Enterobacter hormaechei subsp. oharae]|nr:GpE family phage tail protein [Enterobacter hormaechei subsp. oharae]
DFNPCLVWLQNPGQLWQAMALLAKWFHFQPGEIDTLTVDDFTCWLDEADTQIQHEHDSQA